MLQSLMKQKHTTAKHMTYNLSVTTTCRMRIFVHSLINTINVYNFKYHDWSYQHVHHYNWHSKNKDNEQNVGECRKGQVIPRKKVVMVVHLP